MTPDVNVLVAAFREDHPQHEKALTWLEQSRSACLQGRTLCLLPMVVASFLRLVTNRRVFAAPDTPQNAMAFIDALLNTPGVEMATLGREWPLLRTLTLDKQLTGNDIPDAWIAAAVQTQGEQLCTFDKDFRRLLPARDFVLLEPAASA
jgi:toxin-antitoxin system PIN domain toxin